MDHASRWGEVRPRRVRIDVVEASIADLRAAVESGASTAVEVVEAYLTRIDRFDGTDTATALNSIVVQSSHAGSSNRHDQVGGLRVREPRPFWARKRAIVDDSGGGVGPDRSSDLR
jgi:hypothetical protein